MNEYVKSDLYRYTGRVDNHAFWCMYWHNQTFRWQVAFRLAKAGSFWGKILWKLNRSKHTISIPLETSVGYGLYIGHGGPIICNPTAVIGNNVTLGAGSIVTKDIPDNATAAGNYARVLNYNNPGRYIGNPWLIN